MASYILDIHSMARELEVYANQFFQLHVAKPPKLEFKDAHAIAFAIVDDAMTARMEWASPNPETHVAAIAAAFPWFDMPENENLAERFYTEVVDAICILIGETIHEIIADGTWNVWDLRKLGWDAVLTEGEDYRVLEWERLTGYTRSDTKRPKPVKRKPQQFASVKSLPASISVTFNLRNRLELGLPIRDLLLHDELPTIRLEHGENVSI